MLELEYCGRGCISMSTETGIYLFWICLFLGIFLILEAAQ